MKRIGVEGVKLTEYEMNIASQLVDPQSMKVTALVLNQQLRLCGVMIFVPFFILRFIILCLPAGDLERYSRSG